MVQVATIEVHHTGAWHRAATIERRGGLGRSDATWLEYDFDYTLEHLGCRGHVAVSERFPVDYTQHALDAWPAFAVDLIPQGEARRTLEARLRAKGISPTDWAVLRSGARNPVGNLRVRESVGAEPPNAVGVLRADVIERGDSFGDWAEAQGIPMTGSSDTGGASPKLLLTEDEHGRLHADGVLPDASARRHFIVKFARGRTRRDHQVLANEAPYLEVCRWLGLHVAEPLSYEEGALFVPRFDRRCSTGVVVRLGMESLYSLLGEVEGGAKLAFESVCEALARSVDDAEADILEVVLRDAAALALGNVDNHGRNTAVLKEPDGRVELSPVYDFAPMYLDPDLIKRRTHWRSEPPAGGVPDWNDVCEALEHLMPRERLAPALRAFGEKLHEVPDEMAALAIDADIIERRERAIHAAADSLLRTVGG